MKDSLQPTWLDNALLKTILRSLEPNHPDINVLEWKCNHAVPEGSNYLSLLYRVSVRYQVGNSPDISSTNIIIKKPLESGTVKKFLDQRKGYEKEVKMYKEVLPAIYELRNDHLTARSFDCPMHNSLALEDLTTQGYKMADRLRQLDPDHCRVSMAALARLHAVSVRLLQKEPDLVEIYRNFSDLEGKIMHTQFVKHGLQALCDSVKELEGLEKYAEMINNKIDSYADIMDKMDQKTQGLEVLCHGDTWTNNILFKYDSLGKVVDAKLVDFQMARTSTFAIDIIYFWWTSADVNTRENHKDEMFEIYRTTLNETLEDLGCLEFIISKEDFSKVIMFYAPYSLEIISGILTVVLADPENLANFNDIKYDDINKPPSKDSHLTKNYYSKYYKAVLPMLLQQVEEFGAFSDLEHIQGDIF